MRGALSIAILGLVACGGDEPAIDAGPDAWAHDAWHPVEQPEWPWMIDLGLVDCGATATTTFDVVNPSTRDHAFRLRPGPGVTIVPVEGTIPGGATTTFTLTVTAPAEVPPITPYYPELALDTGDLPAGFVITVIPRGARIELEPATVAFGDVEVGQSAQATVTVANTGNAPVDVALGVPGDAAFDVAFAPATLDAGAAAQATLTYAPTEAGAAATSAALTITGVVCGAQPASLALTGAGVPAQ